MVAAKETGRNVRRKKTMTRFWDEKFEGTGYEETWSEGEVVSAGCTLNEDESTTSAGSPTGWGDQCLKASIDDANDSAYVSQYYSANPHADVWTRIEFVIGAENLGNYGWLTIARMNEEDPAFKDCWIAHIWQSGSGDLHIKLMCNYNGTGAYFTSLTKLSLNTKYRLEVKWDSTNDTWAWRIDGIDQPNDQDDSDPIESEGVLSGTHATKPALHWVGINCDYYAEATATIYFDNYALDDADWVGAEAGGISIPVAMQYYKQLRRN